MKSKGIKALLISVFLIIAATFVVLSVEKTPSEIKLVGKNGLESPTLREYFKEEFELYPEHRIKLLYFEYDLNSDGLVDKIVFIRSPGYAGVAGHGFYVLLNNDDGGYEEVYGVLIHFIDSYEKNNAELFISSEKTNGLHNIIIRDETVIVYEDGRLIPK